MDPASASLIAPVGVITGAVITAAVTRWTTGRTVQTARHSAHVDRQLEALYGFLDVAADLGVLNWGPGELNLNENGARLRKALQRTQIVAPSELQTAIYNVSQAARDMIAHGRCEKPYYQAELKLKHRFIFSMLGKDGVLTEGGLVGSLPEGFDAPAAVNAFDMVTELHRAQDEEGFPNDEGQVLADAARRALDCIDDLTPLERRLLLDKRGRQREAAMRHQFEEARSRLEAQRWALIVAANRWLLSEKSRRAGGEGTGPVARPETNRYLPYGYYD